MTSPIAGTWELVDDAREGFIIITDTHFSVIVTRTGSEQWPTPFDPAQVTDEMRLNAWGRLGPAMFGTVEIVSTDGNTHQTVMRASLSWLPRPMKDMAEQAVVEGDLLKVTNPGSAMEHQIWRRLA